MHTLLINPPGTGVGGFTPPPLNLLYLAGTLEANGIDCDVVDGNMVGWTGVFDAIVKRYKVVGVTAISPSRWQSFGVCKLVREQSPESILVLGGVHASVMPEQCQKHADIVVRGDGEGPLLDICQGKDPVMRNLPIDEIVPPAWHKIDVLSYPGRGLTKYDPRKFYGVRLRNSPRISVMASRSCSSHCTFCSSWWVQGPYRMRHPYLVAEELETLVERGVRHFRFVDDAWYLDREKALHFCRLVMARKLPIAYQIQTRADALDEEVVEALKASGCYLIALGVETGSDSVMHDIHKQTDVSVVERTMQMCRKIGVRVEANLIVGNVGETDETIEETRRLLKRTRPAVVVATGGLAIFPGTAIYQRALKEGEITPDFWETREPFKIYHFSQDQIRVWIERVKGYNARTWMRYWIGRFLDKSTTEKLQSIVMYPATLLAKVIVTVLWFYFTLACPEED